jgi:probable rRNA maturation factor
MEKILVEIFNKDLVTDVEPTFGISFDDIEMGYKKIFTDSAIESINIIFVKSKYIQELNKQYRDIDAPTDVLSFNLTENTNVGEIYICPEYVYETFKEDSFDEEILRLIIHGTLHILGYDHSESMNDSPNEEMFKFQEELLLKYKKICS